MTDSRADATKPRLGGVRTRTIHDRREVTRPVSASTLAFHGAVVDVRLDDVVLAPGSEPVRRDVVVHPGAAAVIALNAEREVAFIQQYRHPVGAELWEIPAGLLDVAGEDPAECARRELREEVDLCAGRIEPLLTLALSPGGSDEIIHVFLATELSRAAASFERSDEEAEFELTWVPLQDALTALDEGRILNATTAVALLATARRLGAPAAG
ncbi:MAG: NUDIX hydrolase [Bowdeniella nasicola]|nr:NUDIX hydrolase [Bowdeniella nasicola]